MSDCVRPHRQQPTRLPRPWDSPGKNTGVGCHFLLQCMKGKVSQSCPTLRNPMDCSPPGSSIHGIFQARVLERVAVAFSVFPSGTPIIHSVSCFHYPINLILLSFFFICLSDCCTDGVISIILSSRSFICSSVLVC